MNHWEEMGELRKTIRLLCRSLELIGWLSYKNDLTADDKLLADCKALVKRCEDLAASAPGPVVESWVQTDHRAAAQPVGATNDAGTN